MPKFGWDKAKAERNFRRHNVTFEAATRVFDDPFYVDEIDDREDYGEERSNIHRHGRRPAVRRHLHPEERATRIISARLAEPRESRRYHEAKR